MKRVLLASPRGYCAGVDRAIETVTRTLELSGPPVYVRKQIVHNAHVVAELEALGAVFVDSEDDVPPGATVVFSAHGVAPAVHQAAAARGLDVIDAACPLVTKVHVEARSFAARGYTIVLIGHAGHEEVEGTAGEAPDATVLVQTVAEAEAVDLDGRPRLAYLTQTTLSVDETREIVAVLERRYPHVVGPRKDDICYATQNRQDAVKALVPDVDLVLVVGSRNSSNSNRLVEVARTRGVPAYLIEDETAIDEDWLAGVETVGLTSGASAPERLVRRVCEWFGRRGVTEIRAHRSVTESVVFGLPAAVRAPGAARTA
ncbi:MAG: 4-hydroxy-3-methylbut-2-enyl diphosphate reductase [Thermoleophilia bacterium]